MCLEKVNASKITDITERYERRAMRSTVASVKSLVASGAHRRVNASFVFSVGELEGHTSLYRHKLDNISRTLMRFFEGATSMTDIALRFAGPGMWIALKNPVSLMANLRRLLVADVPSSCNVSGPHILIEAAPLLESIHAHVPECEEEAGQEIPWQPSTARSLVIFDLVRYTVEVSTVLRRVPLFKHGHVKDKGPCGWEMVTQQSKWSNEEKLAVLDGICCPTAHIEVVLG